MKVKQIDPLKKRKPTEERIIKPPRLGFCKSSRGAHGTTSFNRNDAPKRHDAKKQASKLEKTASGVKLESMKVLQSKSNIFDISMQGRCSFTFEYDGSFHNPCFYDAKVKYSLKLVNAPKVAGVGGQGYHQFQRDVSGTETDSLYGPIVVPNRIADFYFEKAVIEVLGGTEIESTTQTHQITKLVDFHTKVKPEEAMFKCSNLGGYDENYDSTTANQKYQVPIWIGNDGAITATAGADYKKIKEAEFTGGTGANNQFWYTSKGAAKLSAKFNNGAELQFEVPLRRICRIAKCKQMLPAGKTFFITLYRANKSFLFTSQDSGAHQNVIFQLMDCTIEVPIVELTPEKQEEERQKVTSVEGICYSLMNEYYRSYYIYPQDRVKHIDNATGGYKPKYLFLYWVDYAHESDGDINMNIFCLGKTKPSFVRSLG